MPAPTGMKQAKLGMTGTERIDEHGADDRWDRGGVYDEAGNFDLEATEALLEQRFEPISEQLPETVGSFSREYVRGAERAKYKSTASYENRNGVEVSKCTVRIFAQGPCLNRWTVAVREWHPKYDGSGSWLHRDAQRLDSIGGALATALAVMRGEIPRSRRA